MAKSKQAQQPPPWSHPPAAAVATTPTSQQRGRVPSFTADNDDDEAAFWDECDKAAKKNPAPQRSLTKPKKTVDKEEVRNDGRYLGSVNASQRLRRD